MAKQYKKNDRLRQARLQLKCSQEKLAEMVGTTAVTVCRWENGEAFPSPYYRKRLCEVFTISETELGLILEPVNTLTLPESGQKPVPIILQTQGEDVRKH